MNHAKQPDADRPGWRQAMDEKHKRQILQHEHRYGELGELQTKEQKRRLKADLAKAAK